MASGSTQEVKTIESFAAAGSNVYSITSRYSRKENKDMSENAKHKRVFSLLLMQGAVIIVLGFSTTLMAATAGHPTGPGPLHAEKGGSVAVGAAKMVNMEELPMATAAQLTAKPRYEPDR